MGDTVSLTITQPRFDWSRAPSSQHRFENPFELCLPKDYCAYKYQKCEYGEVYFDGCATSDARWRKDCCSTEYYDYLADMFNDAYYEDMCADQDRSEFDGREPDGLTKDGEQCWNYKGCRCADGFTKGYSRNPVTQEWERHCVPEDNCGDLKHCRNYEEYVECPYGTESMCIDHQVRVAILKIPLIFAWLFLRE